MGIDSLSPDEKTVWQEIMDSFRPKHREQIDPGDVAQLAILIVLQRKTELSDAEEQREFNLFVSLGMVPLARREWQKKAKFKPN